MNPTLAVVILNFNGRKYLELFLPIFLQYSKCPVIIADNASTDDSRSFLKKNFPGVEIIEIPENLGFAGGYNFALKRVEAEYYVIVNSDVEVTERWLEPLIDYLASNDGVAAVQPKIKSFNTKNTFEYAGAAGGFIDNLGYPYCRGRIFDTTEEDRGQYDHPTAVDWTSGACMVIRSSVFHQMEGFDKSFFAHMEEIDLCWRLRSAGWTLSCIPSSVVYHVGGGTLREDSPLKTYLNFRNNLSLLLKNLPVNQLIWKLPLRLVLDGIAGFKLLVDRSPAHFWAVLKAHFSFYARFGLTVKKRKAVSSTRKNSVLMSYFVRGKRTYNQL